MRFPEPLLEGRLVERYKRFLADIDLDTRRGVTAHCANPGAMLGLKDPGSRVFLSRATNPDRKLRQLEFVEVAAGGGPRSSSGSTPRAPTSSSPRPCARGGWRPSPATTGSRPEVKYGRNSRVDFLLDRDGEPPCYLEVKNCHLMREAGFAEFPDCIAARSAKHLYELADMVAGGRAGRPRLRHPDAGRALRRRPRHRPGLRRGLPARARGGRRVLRLCVPDHASRRSIDRPAGGDRHAAMTARQGPTRRPGSCSVSKHRSVSSSVCVEQSAGSA